MASYQRDQSPAGPSGPGTATTALSGDWADLEGDRGLSQRVAEELSQAIIEGRLASGARLSEPAIAEAFGISRTPIREALFALERDQLVERPPRRMARVAALTAKQAEDVYVCRANLFGLSARMAATRLEASEVAKLDALMTEMDAAAESSDTHEYFRLNVAFHDIVSQATKNEMLLRLMKGMGPVTLRFRYMSLTIPGRLASSVERHRELLRALTARDPAAAELTVRRLIAEAGDAVLSHFFNSDSKPIAKVVSEW
jgi:DNA-binding GntR family transcriptional regulator